MGTMWVRLTSPTVGLKPTTPLTLAGQVIEPSVLVPMAAQDQQGSMWTTLIFFGVMILVFWLLIIRPQSKQKKKHEAFLASLKAGDKIVTAAGFIGRIVSIEGEVVTIELAKDVRVRVVKSQVVSIFKEEGESKSV